MKLFVTNLLWPIVFMLLGACGPTGSAEQPMPAGSSSAFALKRGLSLDNQAEIQKAIEQAASPWNSEEEGEAVRVLVDVWRMEKAKYPSFNWKILGSVEMRLVLASQLVQAHRNGFADVELSEFRAFSIELIEHAPRSISGMAVVLLGQVGFRSDVAYLERLALSKAYTPSLFREAIFALSNICGDLPVEAIIRVRAAVSNDEERQFIDETLTRRSQVTSGFCK